MAKRSQRIFVVWLSEGEVLTEGRLVGKDRDSNEKKNEPTAEENEARTFRLNRREAFFAISSPRPQKSGVTLAGHAITRLVRKAPVRGAKTSFLHLVGVLLIYCLLLFLFTRFQHLGSCQRRLELGHVRGAAAALSQLRTG